MRDEVTLPLDGGLLLGRLGGNHQDDHALGEELHPVQVGLTVFAVVGLEAGGLNLHALVYVRFSHLNQLAALACTGATKKISNRGKLKEIEWERGRIAYLVAPPCTAGRAHSLPCGEGEIRRVHPVGGLK